MILLLCGGFFSLSAPAYADPQPGDPCSTPEAVMRNGGSDLSGAGHTLVCESGTWKSAFSFDGTGQVTQIGDQICNANDVLEFDGTNWVCGAGGGGGGGSASGVFRLSGGSTTSTSLAVITDFTQDYDQSSFWDETGALDRFQPGQAGHYYFYLNARLECFGASVAALQIRLNGTTVIGYADAGDTNSGAITKLPGSATAVVQMNGTTDYVEFMATKGGATCSNITAIRAGGFAVNGGGGSADNLGDHTATQDLDLATFDLINGGSALFESSGYLNFGGALGSAGYGIRDNAGVIECKDSGGAWSPCGSGGGALTPATIVSAKYSTGNILSSFPLTWDFSTGTDAAFLDDDITGSGGVDMTSDLCAIELSDMSAIISVTAHHSDTGTARQIYYSHDGITWTAGANSVGHFSGVTYPFGTTAKYIGVGLTSGGSADCYELDVVAYELSGGGGGSGDDLGDHTATQDLDLNSNTILNAGNAVIDAFGYLNFGGTLGTTGYGIRDNSGVIECKDSGGAWAPCGSGGGGGGTDVSFSVHRNGTNQTGLNNGSPTKIDWTTEIFDPNNNFDLTTDKFTPTVAGKYIVTMIVKCVSTTSLCSPQIWKNGVNTAEGGSFEPPSVNDEPRSTVSYIVDMNGTTDYIEGYVFAFGGTTLDGSSVNTNMTGALVGGGSGGAGDDLGNHTATQNIDLADFSAANVGSVIMKLTTGAAPLGSAAGAGASNLVDLGDVDVTGVLDGDCLTYNNGSGKWEDGGCGSGAPGGSPAQIQFNSAGSFAGDSGLIWDAGTSTLTATNITYSGTLIDTSDRRLKDNITPLTGALERVLALQGYSFTMKDDAQGRVEYGLMAQDVQPLFPELVRTQGNGFMSMDYIGMIAPLVEAVKEQQAIIDAQKGHIDELATENAAFDARLKALEAREGTDAGEQ